MKKYLIGIFVLFFASVAFSQNRTTVKFIKVDDSFDNETSEILDFAIKELERIFNTAEFKEEVLKAKLKVGNKGFSNLQIYELIMSGENKRMKEPKDYSIDIRLKVFDEYFGHGNFGITNMTTRVTRTHRCFILENDVKCYISHLAHEYMHQIGFVDKRTWLFGKKTKSVPYKIGNIVDKLIDNKNSCLAKKKTCKKE